MSIHILEDVRKKNTPPNVTIIEKNNEEFICLTDKRQVVVLRNMLEEYLEEWNRKYPTIG